jgi:hypothetical protein
MGRLVTVDQLNTELGWDWYFTEFSNKRPVLPCSTFPVSLAINDKIIADPHEPNYWLKNEIRKWVTESVGDMVILDRIKKDYYHYWDSKHDHGYNVNWGYHLFYFSSDAEAIIFKLKFCEHISEILPYDPDKKPNYVQSAEKRLINDKEWFEKVEEEYKEKTKKKDRVPLDTLFATYVQNLQQWDGQQDLIFKDDDGNEVENPALQRRYRAIYNLRRAEEHLASILDTHSTFVPKTRF